MKINKISPVILDVILMCIEFQNVSLNKTLSLQMTWLPGMNFRCLKFHSLKHTQLHLLYKCAFQDACLHLCPFNNTISIPKYIFCLFPVYNSSVWSRILLEALLVSQMVRKFSYFLESQGSLQRPQGSDTESTVDQLSLVYTLTPYLTLIF
jgi:hypothetical protein